MSSESESERPRAAESPSGDLGFALPDPATLSRSKAISIAALVAVVLGAAFVVRFLPRHSAQKELEARAAEARSAAPRAVVVPPKLVSSQRNLKLPASIQPLEEAVIYSRANGYVARWLVDLGDEVKADQLLAEIETPELNQELSQARASLAKARAAKAQAEANRALAISRWIRTSKLTEAGVSSQADLEQTHAEASVGDADVEVADANIAAEVANVKRLTDVLLFAKVTAPFAGTIISRSVDRGSLVTAGNATPLFRLAATDTLRVFVQLPQDVAPSITLDVPAKVTVREFPGRLFEGRISRTAGALDPVTRTLNAEIRVPNEDRILLAGMYADVALELSAPRKVFEIPATALLSDARGQRVAIVGPDDKLHLERVTIDRDLGATLQISTGLVGGERLVQVASADLIEGQRVEAVPAKAPGTAPSGGAGK
jgi:membrane fusion protein (multidrug efflux system)